MDVRISGGDIVLSAAGNTEYLRAVSEAAQRVSIAASVRKGAFLYNRNLGTDYDAVQDDAMLKDRLEMLIREACAGVADTQVSVMRVDDEEEKAILQIRHGSDTVTTEVDYHGNL